MLLQHTPHIPATLHFFTLRLPHEWYPAARAMFRRITLHVGPTNSGKTHAALMRLASASSGLYCGPLRLLAWEIAERLNNSDNRVACDLLTGQERTELPGAKHVSATVEMADINRLWDVAIIDEIQVVEYERLSPLKPARTALMSLDGVKAGDCVVAFSRRDVHSIKREIEAAGKHRCCVVYGSLPPETRSKQAQAVLFNAARSGFGVLVASDAVGMGLNLNIRRVVFSTTAKYDGENFRPLTASELKQIAGRAGRFSSRYPTGVVTCMDEEDLPFIKEALATPSEPLQSAGLFPTFELLELYSAQHPGDSFVKALGSFIESAKLSSLYFMRNCDDIMTIAHMLDELPLTLHDRFTFCISPVDTDDAICVSSLMQVVCERLSARWRSAHASRIHAGLDASAAHAKRTPTARIPSSGMVYDLYSWLSFRLPHAFVDVDIAAEQRALCGMLIEQALMAAGATRNVKAKTKQEAANVTADDDTVRERCTCHACKVQCVVLDVHTRLSA
eukprot:jgi/Chlat1/8082/Chrsp75S07542